MTKFVQQNEAIFNNFLADPTNPKYKDFETATKDQVESAIETLEDMVKVNDSSSNMHYYIGLLKTISGQSHQAVQYFINAVEKSDDNYFNHYFWKGIALATSGCYDLALSEFEVAKNIDKSNFKASLYIGTCFLILGDLDNAYEAFKTVVGDSSNEMEVNYCIGKFFMAKGFMSHAI